MPIVFLTKYHQFLKIFVKIYNSCQIIPFLFIPNKPSYLPHLFFKFKNLIPNHPFYRSIRNSSDPFQWSVNLLIFNLLSYSSASTSGEHTINDKSSETTQSPTSGQEGETKGIYSNEEFERFSKNEYSGRWTLPSVDDTKLLSKHLSHFPGTAKSRFYFDEEKDYEPLVIENILFDGRYRDNVVYQRITFVEVNITKSDGMIIYSSDKASIELSYGRLYSVIHERQEYLNVSGTFFEAKNELKGTITLSSSGITFPKRLEFTIHSIGDDFIPKSRIINYSVILNTLLMIYCYFIAKQSQEAENSQTVAVRISMTTLSWNTIWNFCLFNIHLSYSLQLKEYGYFAIPACMYFILCFIFELKLVLICWKGKNMEMFALGNEAVRKALIAFYIKFYIIALLSLLTVDRVISNKYTLFLFSGGVLIPQIIENAINKSRNTPNSSFAIFMMITQCFFPLYIKGWPDNILELEPDMNWAICFSAFIIVQISILILQRKWGSRFFIPRLCRFWTEYNYYKKFHEDLEQGENSDGASTCCIWLNPLSFSEDASQNEEPQQNAWGNMFRRSSQGPDTKTYMVTPWGHKYHPQCLKSWMQRKLECPFCRTQIPALDEDE